MLELRNEHSTPAYTLKHEANYTSHKKHIVGCGGVYSMSKSLSALYNKNKVQEQTPTNYVIYEGGVVQLSKLVKVLKHNKVYFMVHQTRNTDNELVNILQVEDNYYFVFNNTKKYVDNLASKLA